MGNEPYVHATDVYIDRTAGDTFTGRRDAYDQEHVATPKDQFTMAQLAGSKGSFTFSHIGDLKDPSTQYTAAKYGGMIGYAKLPKAEEFPFTQGCDFYLGPPAVPGHAQGDISYNNWQPREFSLYQENRLGGNDSVNSTVDGDSVDDVDDSIGPDGTQPPANKRDPIYTAISGLKWKAKSKKWVVRWDNPITNRRVYKYFSGIRYGFMGAHKRAKYYLEFLNASVGRLDAPSIGNPFCRRTEGPPKGKANKGLMRKLMNKNRVESMIKPVAMAYGYNENLPYSHHVGYNIGTPSATCDQPKYAYGSSINDPYCLMDSGIGGY